MDHTGLGRRIRRSRERANLTQRDLAEAVGVDRKTVGNWESGLSSPRSSLARLEAVLAPHGFTTDDPAGSSAVGATAIVRMIVEVLHSRFSASVQIEMIKDIIEREYQPDRSDDPPPPEPA